MASPPDPEPPRPSRLRILARWGLWTLAIGLSIFVVMGVGLRWLLTLHNDSVVSRVNVDLRSVARALEEYKTAHGEYPPMRSVGDWVSAIPPHATRPPEAPLTSAESRLHIIEPGGSNVAGLTTPTAFITSLWPDPCARIRGLPFLYHTDGHHYLIFSAGLDGDYDVDPIRDIDFTTSQPSPLLLARTYDPTNGSQSDGDLWRLNP